MRYFFVRAVKAVFFNTPLWRLFLPVMKFDMTIGQLNFLLETIDSIKKEGVILEIGVGGGATSVIITKANMASDCPRPFYAIDTFAGFTADDIAFENEERGKNDRYLYYRSNSKTWYSKTLKAHGIKDAKIYECDAKLFNYDTLPPVAFCLFDVDLYLPTKSVLPKLYSKLVPGGVIVIDDCSPLESIYDGAGQAYREFCDEMGLKEEVVYTKLGILRKPL